MNHSRVSSRSAHSQPQVTVFQQKQKDRKVVHVDAHNDTGSVFERLSQKGKSNSMSKSRTKKSIIPKPPTRSFRGPPDMINTKSRAQKTYHKKFVSDPQIKMSQKLQNSPYASLFTEQGLKSVFKWLKTRCDHQRRREFHDLYKSIWDGLSSMDRNINKTMSQYSVDEFFHITNTYGLGTFTEDSIRSIAAWLKEKATPQQKNQFKQLMTNYQAFRVLNFGVSTQTQEFSLIPRFKPDKLESKAIKDVVNNQYWEKFGSHKYDQDKLIKKKAAEAKARIRAKEPVPLDDFNRFSVSTYKDHFHTRPKSPSAWKPQKNRPLPPPVPYGVLNTERTRTTNQATYKYFGKQPGQDRVVNEARITAGGGVCVPALKYSDDEFDQIQKHHQKKIEEAQQRKSALQGSIPVKLTYTTTNARQFTEQKNGGPSRMAESTTKQHKTPFAQLVSGYQLKSQLETESKGQFQDKTEAWILKEKKQNYSRRKLPSYIQAAI